MKRKRNKGKDSTKRIKLEVKKKDPLLQAVTPSVGRPKLKRAQRRRPPLPRQVNDTTRAKMLKASQLLQKG